MLARKMLKMLPLGSIISWEHDYGDNIVTYSIGDPGYGGYLYSRHSEDNGLYRAALNHNIIIFESNVSGMIDYNTFWIKEHVRRWRKSNDRS